MHNFSLGQVVVSQEEARRGPAAVNWLGRGVEGWPVMGKAYPTLLPARFAAEFKLTRFHGILAAPFAYPSG
jgi:hypothetical protein